MKKANEADTRYELNEIIGGGFNYSNQKNAILACMAISLAQLTDRLESVANSLEEIDRDLTTINQNIINK